MKNDSWLFPITMPGDSFFDSNKDGKLSGFETLMRDTFWLEQQRRWMNQSKNSSSRTYTNTPSQVLSTPLYDESEEDEDEYEWRAFHDEGYDYGVYPEDYETEEEYVEALAEALDYAEALEMPRTVETNEEETVKPQDFPNKRRYEAAKAIQENFFVFDSYRAPAHFIQEKADTIIAANYLAYDSGFLYAQAIKDNFELPCHLPDEDEKQEMEFREIMVKIAKRNIPLALEIWDWCLQTFGPYTEYDEFSANHLSKYVFEELYSFSNREAFLSGVVQYMANHEQFCKQVMSISKEGYENIPEFIATALLEKQYQVAETLFKSELYKVTGNWRSVLLLVSDIIMFSSDGKQLEAVEYFQNHFFPVIKAIPDGMVQDEITGWEKEMADYISDIEDTNEKYAYSRKNAWRLTAPDGDKYDIDPLWYTSEQEYLADLEKAKYEWRSWHKKDEVAYGINTSDYETEEEFLEAVDNKMEQLREEEERKRQEAFEARRAAMFQKQKEEQEEKEKDKTIYTYCSVSLPEKSRPFSYLTDDNSIKIGDTVLVPFGTDNEELAGIVVSVGQYTRMAVPYPVERTKKIIKKL